MTLDDFNYLFQYLTMYKITIKAIKIKYITGKFSPPACRKSTIFNSEHSCKKVILHKDFVNRSFNQVTVLTYGVKINFYITADVSVLDMIHTLIKSKINCNVNCS